MREVVNMHEIVKNITLDSDDTWDGDHDFSFDLTEGDGSLKMTTSYSPSTTSTGSLGRTSKDHHLEILFLDDRHGISKTTGFERRISEEDEIPSVMGRISPSISTNSTSSFSVISYRGRRNSKRSGKITYLDEESSVDPNGGTFKVCTEKSAKSSRLPVDACTQGGSSLFLETTVSCPNDAITSTTATGDKNHFFECPFDLQSLSETVSWSPDSNSAEKRIPLASFSQQQDQAAPAVDWTPGSLATESNVSSAPLRSNDSMPLQVRSVSTDGNKKQKNVPSILTRRQKPPHRPMRLLRLFSSITKGGMGQTIEPSESDLKGSTRESSTSLEDYDDDEEDVSSRDDDKNADEGLPGWYRSTDMVVSSVQKSKDGMMLSDWTILVVTRRQGADDDDKVEPYHIHKSMMSCGSRSSSYFVRAFEEYAAGKKAEGKGAYSIVRFERPLLANMFPYMLDFIYSSPASEEQGDSWERLDRSSLQALRTLGERFGVAELVDATGPCDV